MLNVIFLVDESIPFLLELPDLARLAVLKGIQFSAHCLFLFDNFDNLLPELQQGSLKLLDQMLLIRILLECCFENLSIFLVLTSFFIEGRLTCLVSLPQFFQSLIVLVLDCI